ncbi:MAG TPA: GntR family transcriptional regulator [Rheinheimera sp.]|nr:GntR family transcriptional regulator [Rheinheimera sp.]
MLKKQQLFLRLKQDIQAQNWQPGTVLTQLELAEHYALSRIVVRDVLPILEHEGWLIRHGKAGYQVPAYSAQEAAELCLLRLQLEPLALRLAATELSFTVLGQAEDLLASSAKQPNLSLYQRGELNWQFHRMLYQPCAKPHLLRLLDQLHQQVSRYLGYQEINLNYHHTSTAEHQQLIKFLRAADIDSACALLTQHINDATELLINHLNSKKAP